MTRNLISRRPRCDIAQQGVDYRDVIVARQATGAHFKDEQVMAWGSQIALGLAHLHDECKLVHQDLHNGNVMITGLCKDEEGGVLGVDNDVLLATTSVKILDLGLASFKSDHSRTASERTMRMSTMRTMRTEATRRGSFVQIPAEEVGGFKAIRAPEMHPTAGQLSSGMVRFNAKADVWALGILLTEAILLSPIEE
jgi:serine/threonine protein kinase